MTWKNIKSVDGKFFNFVLMGHHVVMHFLHIESDVFLFTIGRPVVHIWAVVFLFGLLILYISLVTQLIDAGFLSHTRFIGAREYILNSFFLFSPDILWWQFRNIDLTKFMLLMVSFCRYHLFVGWQLLGSTPSERVLFLANISSFSAYQLFRILKYF